MTPKLTANQVFERFREIHGDRYDYSKSIYIDRISKIEIVCSEHGSFWQQVAAHMRGQRCPRCVWKEKSKSTDQFIIDAIEVQGEYYGYTKTIYINARTEVIIECPIHGFFEQTPTHHLSGKGCPQCGIVKTQKPASDRKKSFVQKAQTIYGDFYGYSLVVYINNNTKVKILCPNHGEFLQTPGNHLSGHGCPQCCIGYSISKSEMCWLDYLGILSKYRQTSTIIDGKVFKFDAFVPETNTVYEFYGDFWHGNPKKYLSDQINVRNKKTFGDLYQRTIDKENILKRLGYNLITIWESDWIEMLKKVAK